MKLALLSQDLMLGARVEGAARQVGLSIWNVREQHAAVVAAADPETRLLLVDLRTPTLDVATLVQAVRDACDQPLPIVACGPHVHEAKLAAANQAGCNAVITRGQLDRELDAILADLIQTDCQNG